MNPPAYAKVVHGGMNPTAIRTSNAQVSAVVLKVDTIVPVSTPQTKAASGSGRRSPSTFGVCRGTPIDHCRTPATANASITARIASTPLAPALNGLAQLDARPTSAPTPDADAMNPSASTTTKKGAATVLESRCTNGRMVPMNEIPHGLNNCANPAVAARRTPIATSAPTCGVVPPD